MCRKVTAAPPLTGGGGVDGGARTLQQPPLILHNRAPVTQRRRASVKACVWDPETKGTRGERQTNDTHLSSQTITRIGVFVLVCLRLAVQGDLVPAVRLAAPRHVTPHTRDTTTGHPAPLTGCIRRCRDHWRRTGGANATAPQSGPLPQVRGRERRARQPPPTRNTNTTRNPRYRRGSRTRDHVTRRRSSRRWTTVHRHSRERFVGNASQKKIRRRLRITTIKLCENIRHRKGLPRVRH